MATDKKLSALTALAGTGLAVGDLFAVADVSATATKSITYAELAAAFGEGSDTFPGGVTLDGSSGCNVSAPDTAGLSVTGDLDVAVRLSSADWSAPSDFVAASKWTNTNGNKSWMLGVNSTGLFVYISDDGTNPVTIGSSTLPLLNDGETGWVRFTRDKATGTVTFYWAYDQVDLPNVWILLGGGGVVLANTNIFDSATAVKLGDVGSIAWRLTGTVYRAVIRSGIRGTVVANPDFTSMGNPTATPAAATYTDSVGNVWTMNGTAVIASTTRAVGDGPRWNGLRWVPSAK